jgi:hypothetical protein
MGDKKKLRDVSTYDELKELLDGNEYQHTQYYHYSTIDAINEILDKETIWLTSMTEVNDKKDQECMGEDRHTTFQFCFSTGTSENLPLWYLYSAPRGKGARINIPKHSIKALIEKSEMTLARAVKNKQDAEDVIVLNSDENCRLIFRDVLYTHFEETKYSIKHNNEVNHSFPSKDMKKYLQEYKPFNKGLIWFYEKETRILVTVNNSCQIDKKQKDGDGKFAYFIKLKIPHDVYKTIDFTLSPSYTNNTPSGAKEIEDILKKEGFQKKIIGKHLSEYSGDVLIDTCEKCEYRKST